MNEEVKEILDRLNNIPMGELYACCLEDSECKIILEYINNLQKRKITKEDVEKYFEENMCVSFKKFLENWEEQEELTKYLQEENERLNTELNAYKDEFCKDTIKEYELVMEREYYKSRCEKALKELKEIRQSTFTKYNSNEWGNCLSYNDDIEPLENILNGGDVNE